MPDLVVTVPKTFGLDRWIEEGDPAGTPWTGEEWGFYTWGVRPTIEPGERVYIVFNGKLTPRSIGAFYSFGYRLAHRFDADALIGREPRDVPASSLGAFFVGARSRVPGRVPSAPGGRRLTGSG